MTETGFGDSQYSFIKVLSTRPAAAGRLVHGDERRRGRGVRVRQLILCIEQRPLRVEHLEEVGEPRLEPLLRQLGGMRARRHRLGENADALVRASRT